MTTERDWLLPSEVQAMLGANWTRPRRLRIIEDLEVAGVPVERPSGGVILIYKPALLAYIERARASKRPPGWVRELYGGTEHEKP